MALREGAVVLITGSAQGIGRATALEAAARGARVVVNSRHLSRLEKVTKELKDMDAEVLAVGADVRKPDDVRHLFDSITERFATLDVLVNNAGGSFRSPSADISLAGWKAVLDTNLTGPFLCSQAAFAIMAPAGFGRIINVGSVSGRLPCPGNAHYAAAKAGLDSLTRSLAVEWGRYGIQVNCVAPGGVMTERSNLVDDTARTFAEARIPRGSLGRPQELAELILDLAGADGSYLTGAIIPVDGGQFAARYLVEERSFHGADLAASNDAPT